MLDYIVKTKDNDSCRIHTLPSVMEELVKLELATCRKEKKRPRKEKPVSDAPQAPQRQDKEESLVL